MRATLRPQIVGARDSLVSTLALLPEEDWDAPTLCTEWTVRDVIGHLLHQYAIYRRPIRVARLGLAGFRVNRFIAVGARRWARRRPAPDLLRDLGGAKYEDTLTWKLYRPIFALSELVIHAQDIRRPLGLAEKPTESQLRPMADFFVRRPWTSVFRPVLPSARFEATDADWSGGEGPVVRGPLEAIVMVLAGRQQALSDLSGDGVAILSRADAT